MTTGMVQTESRKVNYNSELPVIRRSRRNPP